MTYIAINRSDSRCGGCNRNADPHESAHVMEHMEGEGCGATYAFVTSDYTGFEDRVAAMRPDLPFRALFGGESA